ncbi:MAG: hypothetical protein H6R47_1300 [Proteobacteria bacterium]|nr:hypothetical protein [Pseudomonadota bacterium]
MGTCLDVLLIERVQDRVPGAIGRRAGARRLGATEVLALATELPLVNTAVLEAREWHAVVLKLDHQARRGTAHVLDRILVGKKIAALDGVVHVPMPVVRQHIAKRGVHATLRGDGVRTGRKHF